MDIWLRDRVSGRARKLSDAISHRAGCPAPLRYMQPRDERRAVGVLTVSAHEEDHAHLQQLLARHWCMRQAQTCGQALTLIRKERTSVIICERELPDGGWKHILNGVDSLSTGPRVIVASQLVDQRLSAEVLRLGGFDVLLKPFQRTELLWAVGLAWYDWTTRSKSST